MVGRCRLCRGLCTDLGQAQPPGGGKLSEEELETVLSRVPTEERRTRWLQVARGGFSDEEIESAYDKMRQTFERIEAALAEGAFLAGNALSLGDIAMVPFVERMVDLRPDIAGADRYPRMHDWLARLAARPSWQDTFFFGGMDARTGAVAKSVTDAVAGKN